MQKYKENKHFSNRTDFHVHQDLEKLAVAQIFCILIVNEWLKCLFANSSENLDRFKSSTVGEQKIHVDLMVEVEKNHIRLKKQDLV